MLAVCKGVEDLVKRELKWMEEDVSAAWPRCFYTHSRAPKQSPGMPVSPARRPWKPQPLTESQVDMALTLCLLRLLAALPLDLARRSLIESKNRRVPTDDALTARECRGSSRFTSCTLHLHRLYVRM